MSTDVPAPDKFSRPLKVTVNAAPGIAVASGDPLTAAIKVPVVRIPVNELLEEPRSQASVTPSSARDSAALANDSVTANQSVELTERELWLQGAPHETLKQMRGQCPVHWTDSFEEFPEEAGFWSVTTAEEQQDLCKTIRF